MYFEAGSYALLNLQKHKKNTKNDFKNYSDTDHQKTR